VHAICQSFVRAVFYQEKWRNDGNGATTAGCSAPMWWPPPTASRRWDGLFNRR